MRTALVLLASVLTGCVGNIGGSGDDVAGDAGTNNTSGNGSSLVCDPAAIPDTAPLRRLSRKQYENSLRDLLKALTKSDAVFTAVADKVGKMPEDRPVGLVGEIHGGFRRLDQAVNQEHVDASYDVATAIGKIIANDPTKLGAVAGTCATDGDTSNDAKCLDDLIKKVGLLAQRRPLDDEDVAFYRAFGNYEDVFAALLVSPRFLYHVEHATSAEPFSPLSAHELAARLSYHFWQTGPDDELRAAADSGALLDDATYQAQVKRLFADARTQAALDDFFREWLWLEELPRLDQRIGDVVFDAFAGADKPSADLNADMVSDVLSSAKTIAQGGGTFADFFKDKQPYGKSPLFASIYGSPDQRVGLLTRPAFLATGSANTRPIMKGVLIRKTLLCDDIPPPPKNANANKPMLSGTQTTREVVEQLTEKPGSVCAGCHATLINPLGFSTENYDALGRFRSKQKLFDDKGMLVMEKAVDTHSVPRVKDDDLRESSGAADVTQYLLESGKVQTCFARQYFRFTFARIENDRDACAIGEVAQGAIEGKSFGDVLVNIALRPEFKRRSF